MEILRMLQDSYRSNSSVKKTFCWVGFENGNKLRKPIKDMNKEEEFSCIQESDMMYGTEHNTIQCEKTVNTKANVRKLIT